MTEENLPKQINEEPDRRFPTWSDLLVIVGIFLLASIAASMVTMLIGAVSGAFNGGVMFSTTYALSMILMLLGTLGYRKMRGCTGRTLFFSLRRFNPMLVLWGFILVLITGIVIEPLLALFPDWLLDLVDSMGDYGGWSILTLTVLAPVLEEMIFRGAILESVRAKKGTAAAILISAAVFGVIHLIPQQVVNAFFIGLILGYIYIKTGSLVPVIIIHALNNGLAFIMMQWSDTADTSLRAMIENDKIYGAVYAVALIAFAASAYMVWRSVKRMESAEKSVR